MPIDRPLRPEGTPGLPDRLHGLQRALPGDGLSAPAETRWLCEPKPNFGRRLGCRRWWTWLQRFEWLAIAFAFLVAGIFQARCLQLCFPDTYDPLAATRSRPGGGTRGIAIAGMQVDEEALRTSVLVTGVTGSAKTAGVLMPALAQLFAVYNRETEDELSSDPRQKIGAFIPEVKGDLVDGCIYLAHESGRCVSRDVMILSPVSRLPVVRYRDECGRRWYLSGRGGAGGSDAGAILPRIAFPPGHPRAGRRVPGTVFDSPEDLAAVLPQLAAQTLRPGAARWRYVGWRWRGRRLLRVSHTSARDCPETLSGGDGRPHGPSLLAR